MIDDADAPEDAEEVEEDEEGEEDEEAAEDEVKWKMHDAQDVEPPVAGTPLRSRCETLSETEPMVQHSDPTHSDPDTTRSPASYPVQRNDLQRCVQRLEGDVAQLYHLLEKLPAEMAVQHSNNVPVRALQLSDGHCAFCGLAVAEHLYCAEYGVLHITASECRRRLAEAAETFRFDAAILNAQPAIRSVLHFWAFSDVVGAPARARDDAQTWLFQHHIRYTHSVTQQPRTPLSKHPDPYTFSFEPFCMTEEQQMYLARSGRYVVCIQPT